MTHTTCLLLSLAALGGDPAPKIPLATDGTAACTIWVHPKATPPERHAADELARFLQTISSAAFKVQETSDANPQRGPGICVGPGAAEDIIAPAEIVKLGHEGYILRTKGKSLAIAGGRPRGTLYGVYAFLEDQLECRWFTPQVARIPKKATLEIGPLDRTFMPRLEYRATDYVNARDPDWAVRNRINGTHQPLDRKRGGKVAYGPFVHTFDTILSPKDHFAKHPEYFSEVKGKRVGERTQLCVTNPEVLRLATETVRRWMREQPDATIFSVSQNDWYNHCACAQCAKVIAEEGGTPCGAYLRFVNAIADAVRDEFPDKIVDTLAYQFTRQPPTKTVPRPNVSVRLCSIECCFAHPLSSRADIDPENAAFARDLRRWSELSKRLYIWDYVISYKHSLLPFPNLYTLRPNINFFIDHSVKGLYEEANYYSKGGELAELRTWIIAKTLWDPSYDTDRAIDEFLDGYYEDAASPLRRYIDLLHGKARMDQAHFNIYAGPTAPFFADDLLRRAEILFDEAEKKAAAKLEVLHRVQVARLPILYVRIAHLQADLKTAKGREQKLEQLRTLFGRFDTVARKEGISYVSERLTYQAWAAEIKKMLGP